MANMVDVVCAAVMRLAGYWLSVGAAIASVLTRALAFSARRASAAWSASASKRPLVWQ